MIKAIVTDIEGTTSSIRFVHEVLFPYARAHIAEFVRSHAEDPHVITYLDDVRMQAGQDLDLEGIIQQLIQWIDEDKKATPLKALQGLIWEKGYRDGDFHGHIYPDAYEKLKQWHAAGIKQYVYSSGSVYAQKLLFGHTQYGDLNKLFNGHFDTTIGAKQESESYRRILEQLALPGTQVLFLSDVAAELAAAAAAGMQTYWLVRDGIPEPDAAFAQVTNFNEIKLS